MTSFEVVHCSSESEDAPAVNLQTGSGPWQTDGYVREATVDLLFSAPTSFQRVEIGNLGCAFIELLVAQDESEEYEALVAPIAVMSYSESKANTPAARSKSFVFSLKDKLKAKVAQQHWTKLRIVCKQTFNTAHPIGLAYVRLNGQGTASATSATSASTGLNATASHTAVPAGLADEEEESAAALFAKIRPATTFAQLKAQLASDALAKSGKSGTSTHNSIHKSTNNNTNSNTQSGNSNTHNSNNSTHKSTNNNTNSTSSNKTSNANVNSINNNSAVNTKNGNSSAVRSNPFGDTVKTSQSVKSSAEPKSVKPSAAPKSVNTGAKKSVTVDTSKNGQVPAKKTPLNKVLAGVVIVISGIQNPERHKLRTLVKEMGGSYRPDWDEQATHLIAVFPNAPKVLQAAEDGATIVTKQWVYDCHQRGARQSERQYLLANKPKPPPVGEDEDEDEDEGPNEYDYGDGFVVADDVMDDDYDPQRAKPKPKKKNKAVMLADDDLDTIHEAEQWLHSAKGHGAKRKYEDEDEDAELQQLHKKVKHDKSTKPSQLVQEDSGEGTEGMAEEAIEAEVRLLKHKDKPALASKSTHKSDTHKSDTHKSVHKGVQKSVQGNSVQGEEDELTDEMREDEIRSHLQRASSQLSRDSQGTQELGDDELLY